LAICLVLHTAPTAVATGSQKGARTDRPNIIFILADDKYDVSQCGHFKAPGKPDEMVVIAVLDGRNRITENCLEFTRIGDN